MITVWVPPGEAGTFEQAITVNGAAKRDVYNARMHDGRRVVDMPPALFKTLLGGGNGLLWQRMNPKTLEWFGELNGTNQYFGQPFPDEHNPPPIAPIATEAVPVMVRLVAPDGVTSFSCEGVEHKVGKDRSITVTEHVAGTLKSHGFVAA